ncbi:MAG: hypothetical protein FJ356_01720 [Thaumarchaeota archaeon]|nr:hypothetical protein [Nitrososphaerota archaeon]
MRLSVKESIAHNTTKILDKNKEAYIIPLLRILQNFQAKRAVSDIIVSLLLVAITVVVGIIMFGIVKDSGIAESVTSEVSQPLAFEGGIKISAYDARDYKDLMGLTAVDNSDPPGTKLIAGEHIVLKITNNSPNSIFLNDVIVNEISHLFDADATLPPSPGGFFSIIPGTDSQGTTPQSSNEIQGGKSVRIVVKLGSISDISLNDAIRVKIDATGFDLQNFIITAGHAR